MEPISFSIGTAIGLAGLYSVCLQAMEQVSDGKNFAEDSQMLYALFETERYLFQVWGKRVGIEKQSDFHRCLDLASPEFPRIQGILKSLETILSNGDGLCKKYGLVSKEHVSIRRKCAWAVIDKKKFDRLVKDIGTLVEKLSTVAFLEEDPRFNPDEISQKLATLTAALDEADRRKAEETIEQQKHRLKVESYIENQQDTNALKWIGAISTEKEYDEAKRERSPGTCDWILSNTGFTNWLCPKDSINTSSILWIHGGAGMGKTFISARITEYLHQFSRPTAFFFCTHSNAQKNQAMSIIRSWIFQLAKQSPQALEIVREFQSSCDEAVTTVLWEAFGAVLKDIGSCYLVLDGLGGCLDFDPASGSRGSGEMKIFIEKLTNSIPSAGVKLLIMSRDVVAIRSMLEPLRSLDSPVATTVSFEEYQIKVEDNKADIKSFAGNLSESLGFRNKDKEAIRDKLSERCGGMFLWARLGCERLQAGMGSKRLETVLTEMPPGLDHAYERNLQTILKKEKYYQDQAIAIFRLVLFALRPLSAEELLHALEINDHQEDIDGTTSGFKEEAIPAIDIGVENKLTALLETCGSLLGIRKTESTSPGDWHVQFIHFSAKEYLLDLRSENCRDPRLLQFSFSHTKENHATLTNTCLLYLVIAGIDYRKQTREQSAEDYRRDGEWQGDDEWEEDGEWQGDDEWEEDDELESHERKWSFYIYACHNWGKHFHLCGNEVLPSYAMRRKIFLDSSPAFDSWKVSLKPGPRAIDTPVAHIVGPTVSPRSSRVLASCQFGMVDILRELLAEARKGTPRAALATAIDCGQVAVAQMLVQRDDVDVNAATWTTRPNLRVNEEFWPRGFFVGRGSALFHGVNENDEAFVRQLFERDDLDVNQAGSGLYYGHVTPLMHVIGRQFLPVFKLLLSRKDINVNLACDGRTPLHHAVDNSGEFLKLLLARDDILVNETDWEGRTPVLDLATPGTEDFRLIRDKGGKLPVKSLSNLQRSDLPPSPAPAPHPPPVPKYNPDQRMVFRWSLSAAQAQKHASIRIPVPASRLYLLPHHTPPILHPRDPRQVADPIRR